jgi:hypothetical protein
MCLMFEKRERDTEKHLKLVMLRFRNNFTLVATVAKTQHSISRYHGNQKKFFFFGISYWGLKWFETKKKWILPSASGSDH